MMNTTAKMTQLHSFREQQLCSENVCQMRTKLYVLETIHTTARYPLKCLNVPTQIQVVRGL